MTKIEILFEHAEKNGLKGLTLWPTDNGWMASSQWKAFEGYSCHTGESVGKALALALNPGYKPERKKRKKRVRL